MTLHGLSLIAGQPGRPTAKTFGATNPANGERLDPDFHEATPEEVTLALDAAAAAFAVYRAVTDEARAALLERIADEIEGMGDALIERAAAETGLPQGRLKNERARTCGQLRLFAQVVTEGSWVDARIDPALPLRQPLPRADLRRMLVPLGPVVVFGSSNFPFAFSVAGGDTASALAAGCPVVVKAHRAHAGTAELVGGAVARAIAARGLPAGLFSLVHGDGATVGTAMVRHPATTAVGFTGSHGAGRSLFDVAAARPHPIPVFAEMSSLNPVFLLPGALSERAAAIADGLFASFTLGVGQFCTKPGLIFAVAGADAEALVNRLADLIGPAANGTMLTAGIRDAFIRNRDMITAIPGVRSILGPTAPMPPPPTGAQPGIAVTSAQVFCAQPALATEAFGPFTLIVLAATVAEFDSCIAALEGQLTATVHATDGELASVRPLLTALEQKAGRVLVNGFPTGVEVGHAMNHGGPYPATSDVRFTSVGTAAMLRFARPVCYQDVPDVLLPAALKDANPRGLLRLVEGRPSREPLN